MKAAYYNEFNGPTADWLEELVRRNLIAPGDVDRRSIVDVQPDDLRGYNQCHFFAGIGGWSYALRLAGWDDSRSVWSGSCPCQPFSAAGKQRAADDDRHLWPTWSRLIRECRPGIIVGEQVAGRAGYAWWDSVAADLESENYAAAAADIGAHSVGAPHIRQRLYWVAHSDSTGSLLGERDGEPQQPGQPASRRHDADRCGEVRGMGDASSTRSPKQRRGWDGSERLAEANVASPWTDILWLPCSDGTLRPTQSGIQPLVAGLPEGLVRGGDRSMALDADLSAEGRVMRLRGYGNAVVPQLAAAWLRAVDEVLKT